MKQNIISFIKWFVRTSFMVLSMGAGFLVAFFGVAYAVLINPKENWANWFAEVPKDNLWIFATAMTLCGFGFIMYPMWIWQNWKQTRAEKKRAEKAVRMHDRLIEALKKCRNEFKAQSDEGRYPKRFLQENGGEGYGFISRLIEEDERDKE